jgi:uncharacterized protein (UPF0261 family)
MPTVVLVGTLDTKGHEYAYLRDRLQEAGCSTLLVDTGVLGDPQVAPDIERTAVAAAAGASVEALASTQDRGAAVNSMAEGAAAVVRQLHDAGRLDGILGLGGSGGTTIATAAMRALPVGVPKLMVSTVASGDTRPYVGAVDIAMMYSVVDIAGINRISARILRNAAAAMAGMVLAPQPAGDPASERPLVAATMFGVTTPAVNHAREVLDGLGYEVVVFHATGTGGESMEALIGSGYFTGVFDLTTTELADELVGGILSAGPDRLTAAGRSGIPQVVSLGALDMVNFGPQETVPAQFADRNLYVHNASVTLMRTTPAETAALGRDLARKLNESTGPVVLFIPRQGISAIAGERQPFHDPAADAALIDALLADLQDHVEVHDLDLHINDPAFATAMATRLHELIAAGS